MHYCLNFEYKCAKRDRHSPLAVFLKDAADDHLSMMMHLEFERGS